MHFYEKQRVYVYPGCDNGEFTGGQFYTVDKVEDCGGYYELLFKESGNVTWGSRPALGLVPCRSQR